MKTLPAHTHITEALPIKTKLSYGLGALGKDLACSIIYVYLMYYFTDVAGLPAAFVGTLFLVARISDAITDPIMGMVVDNTRSKYGKFRPWIVIGTLLNSVCIIAIFATHMFSGTMLYVYAASMFILWGLSYTVMDIPFWSIIPAISKNRRDREKLVVWPKIFASFAWMFMGAYGLWAVDVLGAGDEQAGFFYFALVIVLCFNASTVITVLNVKEKVRTTITQNKLRFIDIKNVIVSNDQLKAFVGTVVTFNTGQQIIGGFAIYYFSYAIGNPDLFPMFMLVSGLAEMAGIFVFPWLCKHLPRPRLWLIACAFPILCCAVLFIAGVLAPQNTLLVGCAGLLLKFGVGIVNGLSIVMLADVVDYGEVKTGFRSEN